MRRPRKRVLLLIVGLALVVPALALSLLSVKLVRDFADIGNTVRREYGDYMAGLAASAIEEALLDQEMQSMIAARFVPPESPDQVIRFLNRFQVENPLYRMAFFVVPEGLVHYSDLDPGRSGHYRPLPDWIRNAVLATLLRQGRVPSGLQHLVGDGPEGPVQVTYFTLHAEDGRVLGAAGFLWDLARIRSDRGFYERTLERLRAREDLFRGAFFRSPIHFTLLDERGEPFFTTAAAAPGAYVAVRSLDRVLPFLQVGVELRDDRFESWIRTVVWTSSIMIVVMFLVIVLTLAFSLRYVLHEIELAEMKSAFVSNVSHELKTPLALIRLFSETLELGRVESPEKAREFLRVIGKESQRLTHLINNVLDVGRIEQGRKSYRFAEVDLSALVGETLEAYKFSLGKQGFVVESAIEDGLPRVRADGEALTQALINLMENAIKYSGEDRFLRVELRRKGDAAVVSVTDRGIGIPAAEQDKIFEKFYRVERGLVHDVKGSGLGLALVRHIVEAHGGRITVKSRPGRGSTFTLSIPLREKSPGPDPGDSRPGPGQEGERR